MKIRTILGLIFVIGLLLATANTELTFTTLTRAQNPVCLPAGNFGWDTKSVASGSTDSIDFDASSAFYDETNGDSVGLYVKNGDGSSTDFAMFFYNNHQ